MVAEEVETGSTAQHAPRLAAAWTENIRRLRTLFPSRRAALLLAGSSALAGFAEAVVLYFVTKSAVVISAGYGSLALRLGPISTRLRLIDVLLITLGALTLKVAMSYIAGVAAARMSASTVVRLRTALLGAFVRASWPLQVAERQGSLQELSTTHTNKAAAATQAAASALTAAVNFTALTVFAFVVSPLTSAAIMLAAAGLFFGLRPISNLARRWTAAQRDLNVRYAQTVSEAATLAEEVATLGVGRQVAASAAAETERYGELYLRSQAAARMLPEVYLTLALMLVLGALAALYALELQGFGSLSAVVLIFVRALTYSRMLQVVFHNLQEQRPYVAQVEMQIEAYQRDARPTGTRPLSSIETIEFRDVSYDYGRDDAPALEGISFFVRSGEAIGIIGPSGSGKSTLVQLLLRLRTPSNGTYLINDEPADDYDIDDFRRAISYVPQTARLLDATVTENIRFFRDDVDDHAIEVAARAAHVFEDIASWPDGFMTDVGRDGGAISGGQRQRICIARALASRPAVLVLDEPTSALDVDSESKIRQTLEAMRGSITMFIVAHRVSTLSACDRIMVIDNGLLRSIGRPDELQTDSEYFSHAIGLTRPA